jgi:hypothetical protein
MIFDAEVSHYEEYLNGVYRREVEVEDYPKLTDRHFQVYRYFPAYFGFNLVVERRGNKLVPTYEED